MMCHTFQKYIYIYILKVSDVEIRVCKVHFIIVGRVIAFLYPCGWYNGSKIIVCNLCYCVRLDMGILRKCTFLTLSNIWPFPSSLKIWTWYHYVIISVYDLIDTFFQLHCRIKKMKRVEKSKCALIFKIIRNEIHSARLDDLIVRERIKWSSERRVM